MSDGLATFSLLLHDPSLAGIPGSTGEELNGNGAGLDFATLTLTPGGPELVAKTAAWNATAGGFDFTYTAEGDFNDATTV